MTVEAILTRELEIRFIDARALCNEAKLGLGVDGYPIPEQEDFLVEEATMIFRARPEETQRAMRRLKTNLDAFKSPTGSLSSRTLSSSADGTVEGSEHRNSDVSISSKTLFSYRKFKMWPLRKRQIAKPGGETACIVGPPQA
jgi:hypothetical protein